MDQLKIIDWELSVNLANGDASTAQQLLQLLCEQLPEDKIKLQRYYNSQDLHALCDLVHKLHGATCYCGVPTLKKIAHGLEHALRQNQLNNLERLFTDFITAIDQTLLAAEEIIGSPTDS